MLLCVKVTALRWALGSLLPTAHQLDSFGGVVSQRLLCSGKAGLSSSLSCKDIMASARNAGPSEDALGFYFCGSDILTRGTKIITLIWGCQRPCRSRKGNVTGAILSSCWRDRPEGRHFCSQLTFYLTFIWCLKLRNGGKVCDVWVFPPLAT